MGPPGLPGDRGRKGIEVSATTATIGNLRFEYKYEFSIPVCRLNIITSHT